MKCEKCQIPDESPAVCVHMSGSRGGRSNRDTRLAADPDYFSKIGSKGGSRVKAERGTEFYSRIGRMGGAKVKATRGTEFYEEIGRKGGQTIKATRGTEHYKEIGTKGGRKVRDMIDAAHRADAEKGEKS